MNGQEVRRIRHLLEIGTREMARLLGVSPAAISSWESGRLDIGPAHERLLLGLKDIPEAELRGKKGWRAALKRGAGMIAYALLAFRERRRLDATLARFRKADADSVRLIRRSSRPSSVRGVNPSAEKTRRRQIA